MTKLLMALGALTLLPGCLAVSAVKATGEVVEGAANTAVFTAKTAGKVAGAATPDSDKDEDDKK